MRQEKPLVNSSFTGETIKWNFTLHNIFSIYTKVTYTFLRVAKKESISHFVLNTKVKVKSGSNENIIASKLSKKITDNEPVKAYSSKIKIRTFEDTIDLQYSFSAKTVFNRGTQGDCYRKDPSIKNETTTVMLS